MERTTQPLGKRASQQLTIYATAHCKRSSQSLLKGIMQHDHFSNVERKPHNSLVLVRIQKSLYYFVCVLKVRKVFNRLATVCMNLLYSLVRTQSYNFVHVYTYNIILDIRLFDCMLVMIASVFFFFFKYLFDRVNM